MSERFLYLGADDISFLAAYHAPIGDASRKAVLLVPPFGWEEISSFRPRRAWAEDLAAHGHAVLRFDLPGTGDSAGPSDDRELWGTWNSAVTTAADWLRGEADAQHLVAVGIGLGGLLAYEAALRRDVDDLVLWATPGRGRGLVRALSAFSVHETARIVEAGAPEPPPLPEGLLAPGGFVLSAETVAALRSVDLAGRPLSADSRVLLLGSDGVQPDPALVESLAAAGADVTASAGQGYASMLAAPDQARRPREVFEQVRGWLDEAPPPPGGAQSPREQPDGSDELLAGGIRERPFIVQLESGRLVGILTEPVEGASAPLAAVFLNAGAIRRIGPHRMWVDAARRWALEGVASLRLDVEAIGDSDGDGERFRDVARFYDHRFDDQARAVLDALEARGIGSRFVLVGLCSGASLAFRTAVVDDRVAASLMLNPGVLFWDERVEIARELRRTRMLSKAVTWKRVLRGDVSSQRWVAVGRWLGRSPVRLVGALGRRSSTALPPVEERIAAAFDSLEVRGIRSRFLFCDGEPLLYELERAGLLSSHERWANVSLRRLPGRDHQLRPLWMHEHVVSAMDEALADELARRTVRRAVHAGARRG